MFRLGLVVVLFLVTYVVAWPWSIVTRHSTDVRHIETKLVPAKVLTLKRRRTKPQRRRFARRNTADLILADGNQEYVARLTIGSPFEQQQTFEVPVDTGSSDTWVAGSGFQCADSIPDCEPASLYKPGPGFQPLNAALNDVYGDGAVRGVFGTETLALAGLSVSNATLGVVSRASWTFNGATSGLLGMGGAALSNFWNPNSAGPTMYDPLFVQMYKLGLVPENFTLALGAEGGYMAFGSIPDVPHNPNWATSPMPPYSSDPVNGTVYGYYFAAVDTLMVSMPRGARSNSTVKQIHFMDWMMVDSGTSANILPDPIANALNDVWDPRPDPYDGTISCDVSEFKTIPRLGVAIGGFTFYHSPASLISHYPNGQCGSAILASGLEAPVILGTPFLQNAVVTFDIAAQQMRLSSTNPAQLGTTAAKSDSPPAHDIVLSGSSKDIVT